METDPSRPGRQGAREALESMGAARRRLAVITPPSWLLWSLAVCMVVEGLAQLLGEGEQIVVSVLVLVAIFALSFAAQRRSGVVTRLTRPPARPLVVWVAFLAIVLGAVLLTRAADHAGHGPLGFFALAAFMVTLGPRVQALWRRFA